MRSRALLKSSLRVDDHHQMSARNSGKYWNLLSVFVVFASLPSSRADVMNCSLRQFSWPCSWRANFGQMLTNGEADCRAWMTRNAKKELN